MKRVIQKLISSREGFIIPLTLTLVALILTVAGGITLILGKELFFSRLGRESATAYYIADTALDCATVIDESYTNADGNGLFPDPVNDATSTLNYVNSVRQVSGIRPLATGDVRCASVAVLDSNASGFMTTTTNKYGVALKDPFNNPTVLSTFNMTMDTGEGTVACAKVTVEKSISWRQIIARGFNTCNFGSKNVLERAVIRTTER